MTDRLAPFQFVLSSGSRTTLDRIPDHAARTLSNVLHHFGKPGWSSITIQPMPDGSTFVRDDGPPPPMLQAAGTAEAMTIEWGRFDSRGVWQVSVLGRGDARPSEPTKTISWNDGAGSSRVFEDEVFDADEATDVFLQFVRALEPPSTYALRELDLSSKSPS